MIIVDADAETRPTGNTMMNTKLSAHNPVQVTTYFDLIRVNICLPGQGKRFFQCNIHQKPENGILKISGMVFFSDFAW